MSRKQKKSESAGAPAWMTTFSDLMSLLLTFFILLFSMSSVSEEKYKEVADSLRMALTGSAGGSLLEGNGQSISDLNISDVMPTGTGSGDETIDQATVEASAVPEEVQELYEMANDYMLEQGIESELTISRDADGVYIDIQESILFNSGSSSITDSGKETLSTLSGLFNLFDNNIIVEGYTDDVPMNTARFPTNWELSTGRAVSVLRYLSEENGLLPSRLSAKGYGEYSPLVSNDSAENRTLNRRVNIIIMHTDRKEVDSGREPSGTNE